MGAGVDGAELSGSEIVGLKSAEGVGGADGGAW